MHIPKHFEITDREEIYIDVPEIKESPDGREQKHK